MDIAGRLRHRHVPCLFDDCGFGGERAGLRAAARPVPGVHNSRAVASPGRRARVMDAAHARPPRGLCTRTSSAGSRDDARVLFWDLYNEPGNRMIFEPGGYRDFDPDTLGASARDLMRAASAGRADETPSSR